jgi:hypothetical protein
MSEYDKIEEYVADSQEKMCLPTQKIHEEVDSLNKTAGCCLSLPFHKKPPWQVVITM